MSDDEFESDDPWKALGLEATSDAVAIKRAYARLLRANNPEDNPEGFQKLRQAYDAALEAAAWVDFDWDDVIDDDDVEDVADTVELPAEQDTEAEAEGVDEIVIEDAEIDPDDNVLTQEELDTLLNVDPDEQDIETFVEAIQALYTSEDAQHRRDREKWRTLLDPARFENLELKARAGYRLFAMFVQELEESGYKIALLADIPADAWRKMDTMFGWTADELDLVNQFGDEWVDPVMRQVHLAWAQPPEPEASEPSRAALPAPPPAKPEAEDAKKSSGTPWWVWLLWPALYFILKATNIW